MDGGETRDDAAVEPRASRAHGVALCLSGGGYRAALFHLGALRRLNELGVLGQVETISSVSGGSIMAAHLATRVRDWPSAPNGVIDNWEQAVAAPFRRFVGHDIRTWPVLKRVLFPWNWLRRSVQAEALGAAYHRLLTTRTIVDLPECPRYILCATDITHGVNWVISRDRVGDFRVGYHRPAPAWPLSTAVAASSCFPPVFSPLAVARAFAGGGSHGAWSRVRVVDGGVYDNLGLEPVWKDHATVLVSDGGSLFGQYLGSAVLQDWRRYLAIFSNQVGALRKRALMGGYAQGVPTGTYWGVGTVASASDGSPGGYSAAFVSEVVARIRTDLDGFTAAEIGVLENHGYAVADASIRAHVPAMVTREAAFTLPSAEWADEARARPALAGSDRRFSLRRLFRRGR
jgi:NTE family protein